MVVVRKGVIFVFIIILFMKVVGLMCDIFIGSGFFGFIFRGEVFIMMLNFVGFLLLVVIFRLG